MMLAALLLMAAAPGTCAHPAAPDRASARRIAEIVIRNRNRTGRAQAAYDLRIEPDRDHEGQWLAYQSLRVPRGTMRGGGGLSFNIDRCTGAVTRMTYQR